MSLKPAAAQIDVPLLKQRHKKLGWERRIISAELGSLLKDLQKGKRSAPLLWWLSRIAPHNTINRDMKGFSTQAQLSSSYGGLLHLTPYRFRRTLGTQLIESGASPAQVADALGNSSVESIDPYVAARASITDDLDRALGSLEPYAKRFRGAIVDPPHVESATVIPGAPFIPFELGMLGECGRNQATEGLCQLAVGVACYTCPSFRAYRDGPHQEILVQLKQIQRQSVEAGSRYHLSFKRTVEATEELLAAVEHNESL